MTNLMQLYCLLSRRSFHNFSDGSNDSNSNDNSPKDRNLVEENTSEEVSTLAINATSRGTVSISKAVILVLKIIKLIHKLASVDRLTG